jgi:hypothetical protein
VWRDYVGNQQGVSAPSVTMTSTPRCTNSAAARSSSHKIPSIPWCAFHRPERPFRFAFVVGLGLASVRREEMSTRAARDEYQPVAIPGPEDVNTTRHGRTPKSNVDLPLRLARLPQYDSVGSSAHWPMGPPGAMIDPRRAAPSFHPFGGLAGEMDVAGL